MSLLIKDMGVLYIVRQESLRTLHTSTLSCGLYTVCVCVCVCIQSMNNAHKDWVCGLAFMPGGNCLMSGCRGGLLKLWHIDNCTLLGEVKAHSAPINAIATNSDLIFSASK